MTDDILAMMAADAGQGMESYDPAEERTGVPFIKVLNSLSKEVTEDDMKAGTMLNSSTKETLALLEAPFNFIPVYYFKDYSLWSSDFKLLKRSLKKDDFPPEMLEWKNDKAPQVVEGINFVVVPEKNPEFPVILSFTKSDFKTGKKFRNLTLDKMEVNNIPLYGGVYTVRTIKFKKDPYTWYGFDDVKFVKTIDKPDMYKKVKGHYSEVSALNLQNLLAVSKLEALPAHEEAAPAGEY